MKQSYLKIMITLIITLIILILNSFVLNILNDIKLIVFLCLILLILFFHVGFEKSRHRYVKDITQITVIITFIFLLLTNLSGLFLGFTHSVYKLALTNIINNIIPMFILIVIKELIRYICVTKGKGNKLILVLVTICLIFSDITVLMNYYDYSKLETIIRVVGTIILPSITKNIMLTYISYKAGYKPCITYRLINEPLIYILPIFPDLGMYMQSILDMCLPILVYSIIHSLLKKRKIDTYNEENIISKVIVYICMIIIIIMVFLVCNLFKYSIMAIGSESMYPLIKKGDAVIIEKLKKSELDKLKKGHILAFHADNKVYVHRIVEIKKEDDELYFQTKGDNNNSNDPYLISEQDVVGRVQLLVPFIGIPTVWLSEASRK